LYYNLMTRHPFHFKVDFSGSIAMTNGLSLEISSAAVRSN
jgi:hypothetical protein